MRSWKSLLALLFALSLVAAACSGDEVTDAVDDAADEAADAAEDAADAATDAAEDAEDAVTGDDDEAMEDDAMEEDGDAMADLAGSEVTITGSERTEEEAGSIQAALDIFAEEHDMTITYAGSADWETEINVAVDAGNPPDISFFPQPGKMADFAAAGHIVPLSDGVVASINENWSEDWLGFFNVDGVQYGVPFKSDLKSLVWYEPARFEELGYTVPTTFDELLALTDQAIADGNTPWCIGIESGAATGWPFTDWVEEMVLRLHGPDVYDQWVSNEIGFSDERIIEAMEAVNSLWTTEGAVYASGGSIAATNFGDNGEPLVDDQCLMHRQANFFAAFLPEGTPVGPDGVDVFYFPDVNGDAPVLVAGNTAAAFNEDPATMAVIEYLGSPEFANARQAAQVEALGGGDVLSGYVSAVNGADLSLWSPLEAGFLEIMANAEIARFDGSDLMPAEVGAGTFWSEGTSFVNGDKTAAEAAEAIDASWPS